MKDILVRSWSQGTNLLLGDLARASHHSYKAHESAFPGERKVPWYRARMWWGLALGISPRPLVQMCAVPKCSAAQCPRSHLLIAQGWTAGVLGPGGFVLFPDTLDKWSQHGREERKPGKECTSLHLQVHPARLAEAIRAGHVWVTSWCANTYNLKKNGF